MILKFSLTTIRGEEYHYATHTLKFHETVFTSYIIIPACVHCDSYDEVDYIIDNDALSVKPGVWPEHDVQ